MGPRKTEAHRKDYSRRTFLQRMGASVPTLNLMLDGRCAKSGDAIGSSPTYGLEKFGGSLSIEGRRYTLHMDKRGNIGKIVFENKVFKPPLSYSFFELDGELAEAEYLPGTKGLSFQLSSEKSRGRVNLFVNRDLHFHFEPDHLPSFYEQRPSVGKRTAKEVGLVLTFPINAVFHLPEYSNIGRMLDKDMPIGETYTTGLRYNFFLVEHNSMWIKFQSDEKKWLNRAKIHIARHPEMFTITFAWQANTDARMAVFSSMDEALDDYEKWLEAECEMRKLKDRSDVPKWVHDIKLVVTVDMMRSNWEITNDYSDLLKLAKELKESMNPKEVLFYIPGWQGPYDTALPSYAPHPELGGDEKFREMTTYLHNNGFKLMIHTTIWGINPYHPDIDNLQALALRDEDGSPFGWQINEKWFPRSAPLKFKTPKIPLNRSAKSKDFSFKTDLIPANCEALFTIGGVKAKHERISLTVGRRNIHTPPGWFEDHDEYKFPFPLALKPGENEVQLTVTGGSEIDWSDIWYKIRYSFVPETPYNSWTFPMLMADTANPEYIRIFIERLRSVIQEYQIDALHTDAGIFYRPTNARELYMKLREQLPGIVLGCEWLETFEEMNHFVFTQSTRQSLTSYPGTKRCPCEQASVTPLEGVEELYAWLDKPSPVCRFVRKYILHYPHLCAANAFVPLGKVCNIFPPRQMPPRKEELWKVLRDAKRLDYVPGLRVNYRQYGLDEETKKAIRDLR